MILGTKARYAVMTMAELASRQAGSTVSLADLAESQQVTVPYLEQIFSKLKRGGVVKSVRGPGGGYMLAKPAEQISIADIVKAVEETIKMTRCDKEDHHENGSKGCMTNNARCMTHDLWAGLERQIRNYLSSISIADIAQKKGEAPRCRNVPDFVLSTDHR